MSGDDPLVTPCDLWYLDCYCHHALGGEDFPVNSYYHPSLPAIINAAYVVLENDQAGIDEVRIAKTTKGAITDTVGRPTGVQTRLETI